MSDHFELALADLLNEIAKDEKALLEKKRAVNAVCAIKGKPPAFANVESETVSATASTLLGDEYFNKKQHTACRMILERRKALGLGPATVEDFHRDLVAGGYPFEAKSDDIAKKGLSNMLSQNTAVFIKLPNGKFSLREWYPNARKPKTDIEVKAASPKELADLEAKDDEEQP